MTTPLVPVAGALNEFILSLLRDPEAAAAFEADPDPALQHAQLGDVCGDDVRTVMPVVVDRPEVVAVSPPDITVTPPPPTIIVRPDHPKHDLIREIQKVVNNFTIDNRATIVDQSVNQTIWAEGDVTQLFDQEAVIAAGDDSIAAGEDVGIDNSTTDIETGDIAVGNTDTDVEITDSFIDNSVTVDAEVESEVEDSFNDGSSTVHTDVSVEDSFTNETETTQTVEGQSTTPPTTAVPVETSVAVDPAPVVPEPEPTVYVEEAEETLTYVDEPLEELPVDAEFDDQP